MTDYPKPTTGTNHGFEPRGRISPFFDCSNAAGARAYRRHLNSYMPWAYGNGHEEQYRALHEGATLADVHSLHVVQIKAPEAWAFADRLITRDITSMTPGRSSYVFLCDEHGTILADPVMLLVDEQTVWMTVGTVALELWVRGAAQFAGYDVEASCVPAPSVQLAGPKAQAILQSLVDIDLGTLRPFRCTRAEMAGMDVVISTTGYSGEMSYEIYCIGAEPYPMGRDLGTRFWSAIRDAGLPMGLRESPVQYDRAREAGMITISHTEGDQINALEFWRQSVVDLNKGDFIGKDALMRIAAAGGPPRRMVGFVATDPEARFENGEWDMDIYDGDTVVGTTRRAAFSRHLNRAIAIGFVRRDTATGTQLTFPHAAGTDMVEVVDLPLITSKTG